MQWARVAGTPSLEDSGAGGQDMGHTGAGQDTVSGRNPARQGAQPTLAQLALEAGEGGYQLAIAWKGLKGKGLSITQ